MFPTGFLEKVNSLESRFEPVTEKALKAGGEVVLETMRNRLSSVIGNGTKFDSRSTGELVGALGVSPMKVNGEGNYDVKVGFVEPRSDGGVNARIANVLEYGKHNQPPRPFLKPTRSAAKTPCTEAMRAVFEEEFGKL